MVPFSFEYVIWADQFINWSASLINNCFLPRLSSQEILSSLWISNTDERDYFRLLTELLSICHILFGPCLSIESGESGDRGWLRTKGMQTKSPVYLWVINWASNLKYYYYSSDIPHSFVREYPRYPCLCVSVSVSPGWQKWVYWQGGYLFTLLRKLIFNQDSCLGRKWKWRRQTKEPKNKRTVPHSITCCVCLSKCSNRKQRIEQKLIKG